MDLASFPTFALAHLPTPLVRAKNLEVVLGPECPRIYIKRDDLTGLAYGGNKVRKLEYLVADAILAGADILVTEGPIQSNHARLTAAAAVVAGLDSLLILDARHGMEVQGNLLLDHLLGAEIRIAHEKGERQAMMATIGAELRASGRTPYVIPTGGSVSIGALGYVAAVSEIAAQLDQLGERPRSLYFATGSNGTHAGLVTGVRRFTSSWQPVAIAVEGNSREMAGKAAALASATAELLGMTDRFVASDLTVDDRYVGDGYAIPTAKGLAAISLLARTEAIFLDPVYSGKAMSGLLAHIGEGKFRQDEAVIFLHTGGGPSLFASANRLAQAASDARGRASPDD